MSSSSGHSSRKQSFNALTPARKQGMCVLGDEFECGHRVQKHLHHATSNVPKMVVWQWHGVALSRNTPRMLPPLPSICPTVRTLHRQLPIVLLVAWASADFFDGPSLMGQQVAVQSRDSSTRISMKYGSIPLDMRANSYNKNSELMWVVVDAIHMRNPPSTKMAVSG